MTSLYGDKYLCQLYRAITGDIASRFNGKIMDYEKMYNEALERAKKFEEKYGGGYAEYIFPELAKNGDERIREWLVNYFKAVGKSWIHRDISPEQILAYIEKQKEQKPAEWSEDTIRKAVKEVGLTQHQIDWFKNNVFPPKPEWSEEDEDMLNSCISSIEEAKENRYAYRETDGDTSYDHEISWLKSLRPQYHGDVTMTEAYKMGKEAGEASHWKPSEEQMEALQNAVALTACDKELAKLYNQLKKL